MSTQIQRRRGTTAEHSTFTGVEGEITVDTTKDTAVVHDGTTVGGHPLQKQYPPLGSAAAPTYTFTGDTNTGIYSPGADQVAVATNGLGRLFVDASGNVKIGSTDNSTVATTYVAIGNPGITPGGIQLWSTTAGNSYIQFGDGTNTTDQYRGYLGYVHSSDSLVFGTSSSERLRITSAGLVGVGTSSPSANLTLKTSAGYSFQVENASQPVFQVYNDTTASTGGAQVIVRDVDGNTGILLDGRDNANSYFNTGGRLGIGNSSPSGLLHLGNGTSNSDIILDKPEAGAGTLKFYKAGSASAYIQYDAGEDLVYYSPSGSGSQVFYTGGTARVTINNSGSVGIGTTSPEELLHIYDGSSATNQAIKFGNPAASPYGLIKYSASGLEFLDLSCRGTTTNYGNIRFYTGAVPDERARIDSSGRLLVGTSSAQGSSTVTIQQTVANSAPLALRYTNTNDNQIGIDFYRSRSSSAKVESTDPLMRLDAYGYDGSAYRKGASIEAIVDATTSAGDMPCRLVFSTTADGASSPTERLRISSSGLFTAVSIYNNTTGSSANVVIRSDGVFERSTSSIKYKTDIEDLQDSYADAILNCRPIWYRSTCSSDDASHSWWGFLAEEVAAIDPRLVHWKTFEVSYDESGSAVNTPCEPEPDGVAYERFVPHLLNLIKRQGEAIVELQAEVAALKGA